ncbi:hypothetical protein SB6421_05038 [Klebsiella huaxiensis]|nr:hypothetical protein SB6421_05038 [Klebsiella huaxiensis]
MHRFQLPSVISRTGKQSRLCAGARRIYAPAIPTCWLDEFADATTVVPDDEIMQHRHVALLELIQKHIRHRDLLGLVERLAELLVKGCANNSQMKALFNYMLQCGERLVLLNFFTRLHNAFLNIRRN